MIESTYAKLAENGIVAVVLFVGLFFTAKLLKQFIDANAQSQKDYIDNLQHGQNALISELRQSREQHFKLADERSEENRKQIEKLQEHFEQCDKDRIQLNAAVKVLEAKVR